MRLATLSILALTLAAVAGCEAPPPPETGVGEGARPPAKSDGGYEADQIARPETGDGVEVEALTERGEGIDIEQPGGRDLCDPSVSEAERRAAGVDCTVRVEVTTEPVPTGLADDPLLQPKNEDIKEEIEGLGLGKDIPATVILQN